MVYFGRKSERLRWSNIQVLLRVSFLYVLFFLLNEVIYSDTLSYNWHSFPMAGKIK